jgi:hypothetical protein
VFDRYNVDDSNVYRLCYRLGGVYKQRIGEEKRKPFHSSKERYVYYDTELPVLKKIIDIAQNSPDPYMEFSEYLSAEGL